MELYNISSNALYKVMDGEVHVLDYETATIHSLNETASFIWVKLANPISKKELIKQMQATYNAPVEEIKNDIEKFLQKYIDKGFIEKSIERS